MRWMFMVLGCVGMATGSNAKAQDVMTGEQLVTLVEKVRSFTPKDQFDTPPATPSMAGKRFSYVVAPLQSGPNNQICRGSPTWGYWAKDGRLEVGMSPDSALSYKMQAKQGRLFPSDMVGVGRNSDVSFSSFTCRKIKEPSYTATNAYGAQYDIRKETEIIASVANFEPYIDKHWKTYWTTLVAGDAARELSNNIRVRISGTLEDWWAGTSVLCGFIDQSPTANLRIDRTVDICMVKGRTDHIEVIDIVSGAILYSAVR